MKSISFIIGSLVGDGAERVIAELYDNNVPGVTTQLILYHNVIEYQVNNKSNIIILGKSTEGTKQSNGFFEKIIPKSLSMGAHYFASILRYRNYVNKNCPAVSVSFLDGPNIINILACIGRNTKCIISLRNNPEFANSIFGRLAIKTSLKLGRCFSDGIITNSEFVKTLLITKYHFAPEKVRCIYNPKNIKQIQKRKLVEVEDDFFKTDEIILLTTGRLAPQKGMIHLIRVFGKLREQYCCRLAICGKGELERDLKELAHDLNIEDSIKFLGWCENPYMYMNASDIFVMSSIYEGQPNALIEALICGCPVVSTDCDSGPREILENGKYGLLTMKLSGEVEKPSTEPLSRAEQDLYDKIEIFLTNSELRKEYANKSKDVWWKFDNDKIVKEYYDAFDEF